MTAPRVIVTIDRLVLRGIAPEQGAGLAAALTAELQRQLAKPDTTLGSSRSLASAPGGRIAGSNGTELGQAVAASLARSLRP